MLTIAKCCRVRVRGKHAYASSERHAPHRPASAPPKKSHWMTSFCVVSVRLAPSFSSSAS